MVDFRQSQTLALVVLSSTVLIILSTIITECDAFETIYVLLCLYKLQVSFSMFFFFLRWETIPINCGLKKVTTTEEYA